MGKQLTAGFLLAFILIAGPSFLCLSQRQNRRKNYPPAPTQSQLKQEVKNYHCSRKIKFEQGNHLLHYPFSSSAEILLVSFNTISGSDSTDYSHSLPVEGNKIDFSKITEKHLLSKEQIDSLTDILYNYSYRGKIYTLEGTGCYNPRNAILFFDSNHELLEYIEICFECSGNKVSSDKVEVR